jgi:hypothetical protein
MPYYKFKSNDIFNNTIKTYPKAKFLIYDGKAYYNKSYIPFSGSAEVAPPVETFFILTEGGDTLITEGGDEIIIE